MQRNDIVPCERSTCCHVALAAPDLASAYSGTRRACGSSICGRVQCWFFGLPMSSRPHVYVANRNNLINWADRIAARARLHPTQHFSLFVRSMMHCCCRVCCDNFSNLFFEDRGTNHENRNRFSLSGQCMQLLHFLEPFSSFMENTNTGCP